MNQNRQDSYQQSPFSAKSRSEQHQQWIEWQCDREALIPVELTQEPPQEPPEEPEVIVPKIRHSQYDAVLKKMRRATVQAGNYTPC